MKKLNTMWNDRNPKSTGKSSETHGKGHRVASLLLALMVLGLFSIPALAAETPLPGEPLPLPDSSAVSIEENTAETPNSGTPEEGTPSPSSGDNSSSSGSGATPVSGPGEGPEAESGGQPVQDPALQPESALEEEELLTLSSVGGSISGTMWMDDNPRDGIWDAGETGIPGLAVSLYKADDLTAAIESATTDEDGLYTFEGLAAGDYVVSIVRQTVDGIEYLIPMKMLQAGADNKFDYTAATTPSSAVSESMTIVDETTVITDIDAGMRPKPTPVLYAATVTTFAQLQAAINAAPTNGTEEVITVAGSFTTTAVINIASGKNIRLTSSGSQTITVGSGFRHFNVAAGATLTMAGNLTLKGGQDSNYFGGGIINYGTFNMKGGTIRNTLNLAHGGGVQNGGTFLLDGGVITNCISYSGWTGSGVCSGGTFIMKSGSITGNGYLSDGITILNRDIHGGGVAVIGGTFSMEGGNITSNASGHSTNIFGGGVYVVNASFTMDGGTISNNTNQGGLAAGGGGGVYLANSTFVMNNGTISNNYSGADTYRRGRGGGVFVGSGGAFTMNGGTITGNTADSSILADQTYGGGGVYVQAGGTFALAAGSITNNTALYGGGIFTENYHYGNPADTGKYANISIAAAANVSGNTANEGTFLPPENAAEFNNAAIRSAAGAIGTFDGTLLNNAQINYRNPGYSLQYKPNNGTNDPDYFQATGVPVGSTGAANLVTQATAGFTHPTPGWVFRGWNSKADASGTWYTPGDSVPVSPTSNRIFYAQWGPPTADVTVSKTITGRMADMTRTFTFTATIWDSTNSLAAGGSFPYSVNTGTTSVNGGAPASSGTLVLNGSGQATFTLGHGQSITIKGVSSSGHIQIAEQADSHYYTSHAAGGTGYTFSKASGDTNPGDTEKQAMGTANLTVAYTNEHIYVVPTGVSSGGHAGALLGPAAMLMALGAWFITQWLYRRLGVR